MERNRVQPLVAVVALVVLAGCSSGKEAATVMPDVVGRQLDVALREIESAGVKDEVVVAGGGTFGIIDKSNWTVCTQSPAAGKPVPSAPKLSVDRSCGGEGAASTTVPPSTSAAPAAPTSAAPAAPPTLTAGNSPDLGKLLFADSCSPTVADFAARYPLATIEFNGSINAMAPHGDAQTRFDIGVSPGDKGAESSAGPSFQFRDVATVGLLTGPNPPATIGPGTKLHVVAQVQQYEPQSCLFVIKPVRVEAR